MNISPIMIRELQGAQQTHHYETSPVETSINKEQDNKSAKVAKKVFAVLGVATAGAALTAGSAFALAPLGPVAVTAAVITGVVLTILATALTIYYVTRKSLEPAKADYHPIPAIQTTEVEPSPIELIDGLGNSPQSVGKKLAEEAVARFKAFNAPMSGHKVEDYAFSLIESQNRYALSRLNKRLREEVGETVTSTIMNDWDLIGHDVRNNCVLMDDQRINKILEHAKKAQALKEDKERYQTQLNTLKKKLTTGEIPARMVVIQKNFPLLAELLSNDSQRKKELDTLLKEAAVKQQMRKAPLFQPSPGEKDIFDRLGLPLEHVDPLKIPESLSSKVALILLESSPFFDESEETFIGEVRKHIKRYAIEERIDQMVQKDDSDHVKKAKARIDQVQDLIRLRDHLNGRMRRQRKGAIDDLSHSLEQIKQCKDEQLKKMMTASLVTDVYKSSRVILNTFLDKHKSEIDEAIEGNDEADSYHKKLSKVRDLYIALEKQDIPSILNEGTKSRLPDVFEWYYKWLDHIKKPFSQGFEDRNEVLGEGVCFAMSLRLIAYENNHSKASDKQIADHVEIEPQDRFFQALYSATGNANLNDQLLSHAGLKNYQVVDEFPKKEEDFLDRNKLLQHISHSLKDKEKWKGTKGVCSLAINGGKIDKNKQYSNGWGHAIYTRIDPEERIYRLFDPNFGLLSFENEDQLIECFQELIKSAYPDVLFVKMESYEPTDSY